MLCDEKSNFTDTLSIRLDLVGLIEDLCCFSGISAISRLQEITSL